MDKTNTAPQKFLPPNLIVFPGGGCKNEADRLLHRFCDVYLIHDEQERINLIEKLKYDIFMYTSGRSTRSGQNAEIHSIGKIKGGK